MRDLLLAMTLAVCACVLGMVPGSASAQRIQSVTFHPDGERLVFAFGRRANDLRLAEVELKSERIRYFERKKLDPNDGYWDSPRFSPDGKAIVFVIKDKGVDQQLALLDSDGMNARKITSAPGRRSYPSFSPDGKRIIYGRAREGSSSTGFGFYDIFELDLNTGTETQLSNLGLYSLIGIRYAGDENSLIFSAESPSEYWVTREHPNFWQEYRKRYRENVVFTADKRNIGLHDFVPLFQFGDLSKVHDVSADGMTMLLVARVNHLREDPELRTYGYDLFVRKGEAITRVSRFRNIYAGALAADGSRVALVGPRIKTRGYGDTTIWTVNADGTGLRELKLDLQD
jgi:dipeptidyl aminopeptidase/acylaminoacyl peptidase